MGRSLFSAACFANQHPYLRVPTSNQKKESTIMNRAKRRAALRAAGKLTPKFKPAPTPKPVPAPAAKPIPTPVPPPAPSPILSGPLSYSNAAPSDHDNSFIADIPEPGIPFPSLARLTANRANAKRSTGPTSEAGRKASSQNRTTHGLARHNGFFKLLPTEDPLGFEALKQSLLSEHQPTTETEAILVNSMAESHWLANRAQSLTDSCFDSQTGQIADDKKFSLYLRYQTTHTRAFHKSFNDLLKLRAENRKSEIGFEAQRLKTEQHEMKKQSHYWDVLRKDGQATHQIIMNTNQLLTASQQHVGFEAQYAAELSKRGVQPDYLRGVVSPAAA